MRAWRFNLRHLAAFSAVVKYGGAAAAARAFPLTQPAITHAIARLEADFGVALFDRVPDGMRPTARALAVVDRIDEALRLVGSSRVTNKQAEAFATIAKTGSYAAAGVKLNISAPTLHRMIADLQSNTGRTLLVRRGRGIGLTAVGKRFARDLMLAEVELRAAIEMVQATSENAIIGRVVIGALPVCRARALPDALVSFMNLAPHSSISVIEGAYAELIEPLRDGEIDFLIGAMRAPDSVADLTQEPLFDDRPVVIGGRSHPLGFNDHLRPADLLAFDWIAPPSGSPLHHIWRRLFEYHAIEPPRAQLECGSPTTICRVLMQSDLLALASPDQVTTELQLGQLRALDRVPAALSRTIGIMSRAGWTPTPTQAAFLTTLRAVAQPHLEKLDSMPEVLIG